MKVLLIRHGKVAMEWKKTYTSEEYDKARSMYDEAGIVPIEHPQETGDYTRIYSSSLKRAILTAEQMFPSAPESMFTCTHLLNEVPLRSFSDTKKHHQRWVYDVMGRIQWVTGRRQIETRAETRRRAGELIELLEKNNENAILITHGFFMNVLLDRFKRRKRYEIQRAGTIVIRELEKIRVADRQPRCGGCHHNCPLEKAGCMIGKDKARREL